MTDFGRDGWGHFGHRTRFLLEHIPNRDLGEYDQKQAAWLHGFCCGLYFRAMEAEYEMEQIRKEVYEWLDQIKLRGGIRDE